MTKSRFEILPAREDDVARIVTWSCAGPSPVIAWRIEVMEDGGISTAVPIFPGDFQPAEWAVKYGFGWYGELRGAPFWAFHEEEVNQTLEAFAKKRGAEMSAKVRRVTGL
jgi:hypothetical protein